MGKNMRFQQTPFALLTEADQAAEDYSIMLAAKKSCTALERLIGDQGKRRMRARLQAAMSGVEKASEDYCQAAADLAFRRMVRRIIGDAGVTGTDPIAAVNLLLLCAFSAAADEFAEEHRTYLVLRCLTEGGMAGEATAVAQRARRKMLDTASAITRRQGGPTSAERAAAEIAERWMQREDDESVLWLMFSLLFVVPPDDIDWDRPDTGALSDEAIATAAEYSARLRGKLGEKLAARSQLDERAELQIAFAFDALNRAVEARRKRLHLPTFLAAVNYLRLKKRFEDETTPPAGRPRLADPDYLSVACACAADPLFWFVAVTQLLADSGLMENGVLLPAGVALLAGAAGHPKTVGRMPVPAAAERGRALLARWIAPILVGYHPDDEAAKLHAGIPPEESGRVLRSFSEHLAYASSEGDGRPCFRNKRHWKAVVHFWTHLFLPNIAALLKWMEDDLRKFATCAAADPDERLIPDAPNLCETDDAVAPPPAGETLYYVVDPEAAELRPLPVELPGADREAAFSRQLGERGVDCPIKPGSLLHALEHFREMPPLVRAQSPSEISGGRRWHKLKRGALRIYVRLEDDGRLLFSYFQRRDWTPCFSRRKYGAH